jgi:hypothetical protein
MCPTLSMSTVSVDTYVSSLSRLPALSCDTMCVVGCVGAFRLCCCPSPTGVLVSVICLRQMDHLSLSLLYLALHPVVTSLVLLPPPVPMSPVVMIVEGVPLNFYGGTRRTSVQPHCNQNTCLAGPHM